MSLSAYARYAKSNADWLGDVPAHWVLCRSDEVLISRSQSIQPSDLTGRSVFHYSIPIVQEIGTGQIENGSTIESSKLIVSQPQVLISKLNPRKGTACIALPHQKLTVCSGEFVPLIPLSVDLKFTYYTVVSEPFRQRLESMVESATKSHQRVLPSDISKFPWAIPPRPEQAAIATFLDRETAKIDELVEEQKRLIELLKEKRQAVISHAVTKGLDPNTPMKDSGIEWLGEVPEHWSVVRLRSICCSIFLGLTTKVDYVEEGGVPLVRALNIAGGVLDLSDARSISEEQHRNLTKRNLATRGDVLLSKSGSIGTAAIVDTDIEFSIYESIFALRSRQETVIPRYLLQLLRSQSCLAQYSASSVGMGVGHLNMSDIVEVRVALPPIDEQAQINTLIENETAKLNTLVAEAHRGILLLQERRSALISAAVTGKIDVRGLVEADAPIPDVVAA